MVLYQINVLKALFLQVNLLTAHAQCFTTVLIYGITTPALTARQKTETTLNNDGVPKLQYSLNTILRW